MQKNVGRTDALIRITGGLLGLAYGIGRMSRRPHRTPWLLMGFSAMKVAEGITRFCPMYAATGMDTHSRKGEKQVLNKVKELGMQAFKLTQLSITGKHAQPQAHQASAQKHEQGDSSSSGPQKPESLGRNSMTSEDKLIEEAVREFVATDASEPKERSASYSTNEHRYPTYS